jgi:hypothetical protein
MPIISHKQKNYENKLIFCWNLKSQKEQDPDLNPKLSGTDSDPYQQNVTDPEHWQIVK